MVCLSIGEDQVAMGAMGVLKLSSGPQGRFNGDLKLSRR